MRFILHTRLFPVENEISGLRNHLEQTADFDDYLIVDVKPGDDSQKTQAWATWNSSIGRILGWQPQESGLPPLEDLAPELQRWRTEVPLPTTAQEIVGKSAALALTVTPWP